MSLLTLKCEKYGLSRGLHDLLVNGELVDVTLACQGQYIQAHKTVLAACSPHFRSLFKLQPWHHPIVFLQDTELAKLQALVDFVYNGEVTVEQEDLAGLLRLAEALKVTGLATLNKSSDGELLTTDEQHEISFSQLSPPSPPPAKIARRSHNSDVSKRDTSPELAVVATSVQTNSQVEQEPLADQSWLPAIAKIRSMVQGTWAPCSETIIEQPWTPETESGCPVESLKATAEPCSSFMVDDGDIKVEQEELHDLTEDSTSNKLQECDAEYAVEDDSSNLSDETSLQGDSWCEAGPPSPSGPEASSSRPTSRCDVASTEPSTSGPEASTSRPTSCCDVASTEPSTSGLEASTSRSTSSCDVASTEPITSCPEASTSRPTSSCDVASTEKPSQLTAVPGVSTKGNHLRKRVLEPQDSESENKDGGKTSHYLCQYCDVHFKCETSLQSHVIKSHDMARQPEEVTFKCELCPKFYKRRESWRRHYRQQHPRKLRFFCKICNAKFSKFKEFQNHKINLHTKEIYPFVCKNCGKKYTQISNFKHHLKIVHGENSTVRRGEKTVCIICFEKFPTLKDKKKHVAQCHPELCFTCRLCPRVYHDKHIRQRHELMFHRKNIESPKRFFQCKICGNAVTSQSRLKLHVESVHGK